MHPPQETPDEELALIVEWLRSIAANYRADVADAGGGHDDGGASFLETAEDYESTARWLEAFDHRKWKKRMDKYKAESAEKGDPE